MNNWDIPNWLEKKVQERDKACVYCGIQMIEKMPPRGPRRNVATWEHIICGLLGSQPGPNRPKADSFIGSIPISGGYLTWGVGILC
jgi:hypothetical protein